MPRAEIGGLESNVGAAVRTLRRQQGLSVEALAKRLEMSVEDLESLEAGNSSSSLPAQDVMARLERELSVSLAELAEQTERCRQAACLRQLAGVLEDGLETGTQLQRMQLLLLRGVLFGETEDFAELVHELRGVLVEPRS